ncbi:hypothetical protein ACFXPA_32710 [Amycolatopsis sp. NPDC059090]|uniref:hypothetical protein n=1 Tax=unclassified Amycolatopsis TaxID=2618356 RepID=UPI00366DB206
MGFLEMIEDVGHWVGEHIDDLGKFYSVALRGDTGAQAMSAPELAEKVLAGPGTAAWHEGAGQAVQLGSQHHEASDLVARMSTGLESAWTGRAADAAQTRIRALTEIASVSAAIYTTNGANLSDVAHGFDAMKTSLQPMPGQPPHLTFLDRAAPWETDAEKEINQYNAVAQQNLDRYQAYVQHARAGSQQLQTDYGRLDDFGGRSTTMDAKPKPRQGPEKAPHFPQPRHSGQPPDAPPPASAPPVSGVSAPPPGPGITQVPAEKSGPSTAPPSRTGDQTTASGWTPDPSTPGIPPTAAPLTGTSGTSGSDSNAWSPGPVGIPTQGGRGTAGNVGGRTGGTAGGESNRTGIPRSRTDGPPRPGIGRGTGAGEEPRAPGNTPRGITGAPGSRGTPGMAGTTPPRDKDKTEDPQEHRRKYGLDTDSAFSLTDDDGERTVDPRTGLPPTPPTIGG